MRNMNMMIVFKIHYSYGYQISEFDRLELPQEMQSDHLTCCPKVPVASAVGFSLLRHVSYNIPKSCDLKIECCKHYVSPLYISYM